jgi:adenylosuccinate lyase
VESAVIAELPFMATEEILLAGGDRQELHELIRVHSQLAAKQVKLEGKPNDLIARLKQDSAFSHVKFDDILHPSRFIGRAPQQVDEFIDQVVAPIRSRYGDALKQTIQLKV